MASEKQKKGVIAFRQHRDAVCFVIILQLYRVFKKDVMSAVYRQYKFDCSNFHCIAATHSSTVDLTPLLGHGEELQCMLV
jgi:hypothetical protein